MNVRDLLKELADLCKESDVDPLSVEVLFMGGDHLSGKPALAVQLTPTAFTRLFAGKQAYLVCDSKRTPELKTASQSGRIHFTANVELTNLVAINDGGFRVSIGKDTPPESDHQKITQPRDGQGRFTTNMGAISYDNV